MNMNLILQVDLVVYFVVKRRVLIAEEGMLLYSESQPTSRQSDKKIQGKIIYLHSKERRTLKIMIMLFIEDSKS